MHNIRLLGHKFVSMSRGFQFTLNVSQLVPSCDRPRFGTRLNKYNRIRVTIDRILLQPVEIVIQMDSSTCGDVSSNDLIGVT